VLQIWNLYSYMTFAHESICTSLNLSKNNIFALIFYINFSFMTILHFLFFSTYFHQLWMFHLPTEEENINSQWFFLVRNLLKKEWKRKAY